MTTSLTIAMSVAEASGDLLAAHLISAIKKRCPDARLREAHWASRILQI